MPFISQGGPSGTPKYSVVPHYISETDPALDAGNNVLAGKVWIKRSTGEVKLRNDDNDDWDIMFILAGESAAGTGVDADTLDGFDSADFATPADLADYVPVTDVGAAGGVASLDGGGKVPSAQIPAVALVKPTVVADLAARLALTAQAGDVAVQTDTSKSYMLKEAGDPTVDADWIELKAPTGAAPSGASFITYSSEASLSAERVLTDSSEITGDTGTAGQFKLLIAALSIATGKIIARAVTWAKVQAISTGVLLGRTTASSGDVEEITPSARFSLSAGALDLTNGVRDVVIPVVIGDGVNAITTGVKGYLEVPFACTIVANRIGADASGSIVIDIWKDTYANFPPTVADTITASAKPTLSSAQKSQDTTLTGWTTSVAAGDWLAFNVDSATTVKQVTLSLTVRRTG